MNLGWLAVAMAAVWITIGLYLLSLAVRQKKLEERLEGIEARRRDTG